MRLPAAALLLAVGMAPAHALCDVATGERPSRTPFFLGIEPMDGPAEVFCKLQQLKGRYRVNLQFRDTGVDRTKEFSFDGARGLGPEHLTTFLQSLFPTERGPEFDPVDGKPFPKVLKHVVQGRASQVPGGGDLQIPDVWQGARQFMLWEKFAIRLRPMPAPLEGFTLTVNFRPSPGRFVMEASGRRPSLHFRAWKPRLPIGSSINSACSEEIPICKDLPEVVPVRMSHEVEEVRLDLEGDNLAAPAEQTLTNLETRYRRHLASSNMRDFDPVRGRGHVEIRDGTTVITGESFPPERGKIGPSRVSVVYAEEQSPDSYRARIDNYFREFRDALVRQQSIDRKARTY
ncbi:hypothetical protein BHAOGJBA_4263 [Methylobacterium hispanicum]|uniref:Tle cognate immunity protein 4 C-terminal domain-containing protein n=1 Tax=Methylobacterium hispanicum TaxID=270350 RepID=A0AAV4ZRM9_9HYPH|nr:hypothetical protein [Methylobacterium hispanicum]GJD90721.1 hypothetical protein BHAOGJBA_4263 [Methylobacterium hispanicum]